jgi:protein-disulfide isomerase
MEEEMKEMGEKGSKQLFVITTDNVWKIATVVLAIIVLAFIARDFMGGSAADTGASDTVVADTGSAGADAVDFSVSDADRVKGDVDAPVTIIEYSDFQCPYCQRFYEQTLGSIVENYVDSGQVNIVYRHFPLSFHQNAQIAAEASECAGDQDMFWELHDIMFDRGAGDGTGLARADLESYASELGMDLDAFSECLDSGKYTEKVENDMATGATQGVRGTPGFLVNGVLVSGAQPYSVFEAAIEAALAE